MSTKVKQLKFTEDQLDSIQRSFDRVQKRSNFVKKFAQLSARLFYKQVFNKLQCNENMKHEYMRHFINTLSELNANIHSGDFNYLEEMRKRDLKSFH